MWLVEGVDGVLADQFLWIELGTFYQITMAYCFIKVMIVNKFLTIID